VALAADLPLRAEMIPSTLISIVDDDASVREALRALMKSMGYAVEVFPSATEFLASPQLRSTSCLIADVQMPVMTGVELYNRLIDAGHLIPTILLTAYPDNETGARMVRDGAVCYLSKPFNDNVLLGCVHSALQRGQRTGAPS
jgi:FixJ family two-component response regulator